MGPGGKELEVQDAAQGPAQDLVERLRLSRHGWPWALNCGLLLKLHPSVPEKLFAL